MDARKPTISTFNLYSDSLSDLGVTDNRKIGPIPMSWITGLATDSPRGLFSNGYGWAEYLITSISNRFLINTATHHNALHVHHNLNSADIADDILTGQNKPHAIEPIAANLDVADRLLTDTKFDQLIDRSYDLGHDKYIRYQGRDILRSYAEGGVTAHNYRWSFTPNIKLFFTRLILRNLTDKRKASFEYNKQHKITAKQKSETLVFEWTGANDLITVNESPTRGEADKAVMARINNLKKLVEHGYRNIILMNLPNLSKVPRFANMKGDEGEAKRANAGLVSDYFNEQLRAQVDATAAELKQKYPDVNIELFDVNQIFLALYNDTLNETHLFPGKLSKDKLNKPFVDSKDFNNKNGISSATGYFFWDDVHPAADTLAIIADILTQHCREKFNFVPPKADTAQSLCDEFRNHLKTQLSADRNRFFSQYKSYQAPALDPTHPQRTLQAILAHAKTKEGKLTQEILTELGWCDANGALNTKMPPLKMAQLSTEHRKEKARRMVAS